MSKTLPLPSRSFSTIATSAHDTMAPSFKHSSVPSMKSDLNLRESPHSAAITLRLHSKAANETGTVVRNLTRLVHRLR